MNILLIGNDPSSFATLANRLGQEDDVTLVYADSEAAGLERVRARGDNAVDLVIVGGPLTDMDKIRFVRQLVQINPLVNTVVIGSLPDEAFHEATEGLGVLLQLSPQPGEDDAENLLALLRKITVLMQPESTGAGSK
ncbi:MAG TPA: response regulator [Desulfobulbaceae bacterium]|nr:response regulator [Desulfobulbaceae bacterium]